MRVEPEANPFSGILKLLNSPRGNQKGTFLTFQDLFPDSIEYNFIR